MTPPLSLLAGLAALALATAPVLAADNPWRSGGDFYGNGEAKPAPKAKPQPKSGAGFGQPSKESLYPPLNEDEVLPPAPAPKGGQAPVYPPLDTAEPKARTAPPPVGMQGMQGQPPAYRPPPAGYGPGYGYGTYGYPGYGYGGGWDPALGGWPGTGLGWPGASPWLGGPGLW